MNTVVPSSVTKPTKSATISSAPTKFIFKEGVTIRTIALPGGRMVQINSIDCGVYSFVIYDPLGKDEYARYQHLFYCHETGIDEITQASNESIEKFSERVAVFKQLGLVV